MVARRKISSSKTPTSGCELKAQAFAGHDQSPPAPRSVYWLHEAPQVEDEGGGAGPPCEEGGQSSDCEGADAYNLAQLTFNVAFQVSKVPGPVQEGSLVVRGYDGGINEARA